jgi:hypothetical protein
MLHDDAELRQRLVDGGIETMDALSWETEMTKIHSYVAQVSGADRTY